MIRRPCCSRSRARSRTAALLVAACAIVPSSAPAADSPTGPPSVSCHAPRSLAEILDLVQDGPRAEAGRKEAAAVDGLVRQAGTRPNPEIAVEVEDFTGSGSYTRFGQTQTTVSLAQRVELGGVRARRVDLATREGQATVARGAEDRTSASVAAKQRFVDALAARERAAVAAEGERLAREVLAAAERRVAAGAGSAADAERARVAMAQAGLQRLQAERDGLVAAARLASLWGGDDREAACADRVLPRTLPSVTASHERVLVDARSPAVATAEAEVEAGRAAVDLAKASAAPDLEVGAGLRHLAGPGEMSVVAGLRIEVPIFDRKDGAIAAAEQQLLAAQARARAVRGEAAARSERLARMAAASAAEVKALDDTMLPAAQRAWSALSRAWQTGAASALDVLDARRSLVELRLQRIAALREYHVTSAALEGSLGRVTAELGN